MGEFHGRLVSYESLQMYKVLLVVAGPSCLT